MTKQMDVIAFSKAGKSQQMIHRLQIGLKTVYMDCQRMPAKMTGPSLSGPVNDQHIIPSLMQRSAGIAMLFTEFGKPRANNHQTPVFCAITEGICWLYRPEMATQRLTTEAGDDVSTTQQCKAGTLCGWKFGPAPGGPC